MKFEDWMVSQGLSASSIKKYAGAIDGRLTDWGTGHASIRKPLRTIHDSQEFAALSELIEGSDIFAERNARGNHMYGAALKHYARYLVALARNDDRAAAGPFGPELEVMEAAEALMAPFEPKNQEDGRERVLRSLVRRQGQPQFRAGLIGAYDARCAITRCPLLVILEAAHITPYLGPGTNLVSNGLLLRADIHTLWDRALIAINPTTMLLAVSPEVRDDTYQSLFGTPVYQPVTVSSRPSMAALQQQWSIFYSSPTA